MSYLLSDSDLEDTIEALEFLMYSKGQDFVFVKRNRMQMLLSWLKLQQSKLATK